MLAQKEDMNMFLKCSFSRKSMNPLERISSEKLVANEVINKYKMGIIENAFTKLKFLKNPFE